MKAKYLRAADASVCRWCGTEKMQAEKPWLLTDTPMVWWACPKCDWAECVCVFCKPA